jgi:HupE / UreJ protein
MSTLRKACLVSGVLVLATPAWAHAPIMGIGGVAGGFLHALLIPEHGMGLLALGLALARQEPGRRWSGEVIFCLALFAGLVAAGFGLQAALAGDVLLAVTGLLGLLIAVGWLPGYLTSGLALIVGVAFALDSIPDATSTDETIRMLIGSAVGGALALVVVAEGLSLLRQLVFRSHQRIPKSA